MLRSYFLLIASFLLFPDHVYAQDDDVLTFAIKYQPNTTYSLVNTSKTSTKIELTGLTPEAKEKLLAKAAKPTLNVVSKDMAARIMTGSADSYIGSYAYAYNAYSRIIKGLSEPVAEHPVFTN